jgi:hypothetical protein
MQMCYCANVLSIQLESAQQAALQHLVGLLQCSAVQFGTLWCSAVQCSAVQCSAVQCSGRGAAPAPHNAITTLSKHLKLVPI